MVADLFTAIGLLLPILALRQRVPQLISLYLLCALGAEPHVLTLSMGLALSTRVLVERSSRIDLLHPVYFPCAMAIIALSLLAFYGLTVALINDNTERMLTEAGQYLFGAMLVIATCRSCSGALQVRTVLRGLVTGAFILSSVKLLSHAGVVGWETPGFISAIDSNYAASYMLIGGVTASLVLLRSAGRKARLGLALCWVLSIAGIVLNSSRANLFTAVAVTSIWVVTSKPEGTRSRFLFLLALAVGYIAFFGIEVDDPRSVWSMFGAGSSHSNSVRLHLLLQSWSSVLAAPLGIGIGASSDFFSAQPIFGEIVPHPHNTIAQLAVEMGIFGAAIGFAALCWLLWVSARELFASRKMALRTDVRRLFAPSLATWALFDSVVFNGPVMMVYLISLGVLVGTDLFGRES